ncbi:Centromere protein W [Bos mutus]|uniref:Centromere protein W n=1 Tax=Bos mutus TaxID=72004 RepID=L8IZ12_9CETA|nr:Centromere protein W [Bos mutus]
MALSTTVSQRKMIRRKAPRGFLKRIFKRQKPHLRLETSSDLLVRFCPFIDWHHYFKISMFEFKNCFEFSLLQVHLNCLLFVHRLAEESRINACGSKCGVIKKEHVLAAAKVILKKSRG